VLKTARYNTGLWQTDIQTDIQTNA